MIFCVRVVGIALLIAISSEAAAREIIIRCNTTNTAKSAIPELADIANSGPRGEMRRFVIDDTKKAVWAIEKGERIVTCDSGCVLHYTPSEISWVNILSGGVERLSSIDRVAGRFSMSFTMYFKGVGSVTHEEVGPCSTEKPGQRKF